jgi:formiminotetrahydrofolate cyclodeaminase
MGANGRESMDERTPRNLLERTTPELLEAFAAGTNTPGAGSAAALAGAVAGSLLQASAQYAVRAAGKGGAGSGFLERAGAILEEARERSRRLSLAVDEDAAAFQRYWRDRTDEALRQATDVPLGIAEECAALAEAGVELYDRGFRNARGETGTAVLAAVASGEAALYVARLNLGAAREPLWTGSRSERIQALRSRLEEAGRQIRARIEAGKDAASGS